MAHQLLKNTSMGSSLRESLNELIPSRHITPNNFELNDVEFREVTELIKLDKVKIVACNGKNTGSSTTE
ncbi:hypothetical protein FD755_002451 [Muntiacus reevesi]|uniref:Transcription initiation factor IIA gamma subunit C-terminal domain-containing protein n=1 Tax=Muntiacus reevesi TaxID=9886 RepID=A0A5J5N498_MUNRE|nr:hypothetical protein FD755_002451 [Muntiacus reevesi]